MASIKSLYTRAGSNAGRVMPVLGPDRKETGSNITVRGVDSEACQTANRTLRRNLMAYVEANGLESRKGDEYNAFAELEQRKVQAALVADWSFEEPCTEANVLELFTQAPYIAEQVDDFAGKRERFVEGLPSSSEPSQDTSSASPSPSRKVQK